jgi:hypothetical protein
LAKPHYVVRRSRSGRFNFILITDEGRLIGSVPIKIEGGSSTKIERQARDKIRSLSESFAETAGVTLGAETKVSHLDLTPASSFDHLDTLK